jgi:frataxin-like iron-binding protein CyaY
MIPREEIIKQINRFYDLVETKGNKIQEAIDNNKEPENYDIGLDYFKLTSQIGTKMQYAISELKDELDMMES